MAPVTVSDYLNAPHRVAHPEITELKASESFDHPVRRSRSDGPHALLEAAPGKQASKQEAAFQPWLCGPNALLAWGLESGHALPSPVHSFVRGGVAWAMPTLGLLTSRQELGIF